MREFNLMFVFLAVGLTVVDFAYLGVSETAPLSPYLVPVLLGISYVITLVTLRTTYKVALFNILFLYFPFCAVFVGVCLPIYDLIHIGFSGIRWVLPIVGLGFAFGALLSFIGLRISVDQHLTSLGKGRS